MAPKGIVESCWRKDRGALPKEECDATEENFLRRKEWWKLAMRVKKTWAKRGEEKGERNGD